MRNPGERGLALLTEKQLPRGVHQSGGELDAAIDRYLDTRDWDCNQRDYLGTALMVSMWLKFQPAVPVNLYSATISGLTAT